MLFFSRFTAEAAWGLSTSVPVSSTNTVVTMKKINKMKTMSINGETLMSETSSASTMALRYLMRGAGGVQTLAEFRPL
jgi:hypothetical protein